MKPTVSVIVPAWNAAEFLERCLDSIKAQSFEDFEVWIVNPSSDDNTAEIAEHYCRADRRFNLINCEKVVPGIARNKGMDKAKGKYIAFTDADDTMEPDFLRELYNTAISENADITVCDFNMVCDNLKTEGYSKLRDYTISVTDDNLVDYYYRFCAAPKPNNYVWSHFYRTDFIDGLRHQPVLFGDDHMINLQLLCRKPKIAHIGKSMYNYIQHDASLMHSSIRKSNHGVVYLQVYTLVREVLENQNALYAEPVLAIYAYTRIKSILFYAWQAGLDEDGIKKACLRFLADKNATHYLKLCIDNGYIEKYCRIHDFSTEWEMTVREMICACLSKTKLPDMKEIFQ